MRELLPFTARLQASIASMDSAGTPRNEILPRVPREPKNREPPPRGGFTGVRRDQGGDPSGAYRFVPMDKANSRAYL